jgi:uncharacterized membrane protein YidH (DUF202 family)
MAAETGEIRDHLANERTQLAWMRTGANVMVIGLAVARFADNGSVTVASLAAGGLLILVGAFAIGYGTLRYRRVTQELRTGTAATEASSTGPTIAAGILVLATVVSAVILLLSA